jgi:hypothetical protein
MAFGAVQLVGDLGLVVAFDGDPENIARLRNTERGMGWRIGHESYTPLFRRGATSRSQGGVEVAETVPYWLAAK